MGKGISRLGSVLCGYNRVVVNDTNYRHKRQLGEGAFSYVDLVERVKTGEQFAIKRIVCHDKHAEEEGIREAKGNLEQFFIIFFVWPTFAFIFILTTTIKT